MSSEVKANKLSPATGADVVLGDASDTFTVPSGATLDVSSATMTGFTIPSGQTLTVASGATIDASAGTATGFGGDNTPSWHVHTSTAQSSLSENTWIKVEFDTEIIDTDSAYDNSTNYRFTVPSGEGGTYFVYARVYVQSSSAYLRQWGAKVYKNGAEVTGQIGSIAVGDPYPTRQVADAYGIVDLSVADYLEVYGWVDTNSGGTGLFQASNTSFGGYKLL
jgi:hypothetical protein